jgi:penicillin amidase
MNRSRRILLASLSTVVGTAVVVVGAAVAFLDHSLPSYTGQADMPGLSAPATIYRDPYGVPHIFAATTDDAARALGYVHASERLFQMEMQRRAGQGRLSEVIGDSMLDVDKFVRTMGFYHLAESSFAALSPEAQRYFQAYADGVNAWLSEHPHSLPPEFALLRFKPEPWRPADSVVWGKLMALQLSHNYRLEMLRAHLADKLTPEQVQMIFPPLAIDTPLTTQPHPRQQNGLWIEPEHQTAEQQLDRFTGLDHGASNEWVISGALTDTGKPILANDPHLGLEAPILWYLARIVTPDFTVKGATIPGLPIVLLGQNGHIAWGMTTTGSDVEDLFVETVDSDDADRYLTPEGPKPFDHRQEIIHIKGGADLTLDVRSTRHGPVLSDIDAEMRAGAGDGKVMALAFAGLGDRDTSSEALLQLNHAENWQEFRHALELYQGPPQNIVYADIDGNIGFINPGLVPVRKKGDGLTPADGASGDYDWRGFIPASELPQLYNPTAGFIFNANNALQWSGTYYYGTDWEESFRAERLQYFFATLPQHTLATTAAMQADHTSMAARSLLPYLLRVAPNNPRAAQAVALLKNWDGNMDKDRPEPLMFEAWLYQMHKHLLVDKSGDDLKEKGPYNATAIGAILSRPSLDWCGEQGCDVFDARMLDLALDMIAARQGPDMQGWRWGREHVTQLRNKVFGHIPFLRHYADLDISSSGDFYTLDRGGSFEVDAKNPFTRTHGGGYRGIYDLGDPDGSRFMIATGQSGHFLSRHYGDLVSMWNDVKSFTLSGSQQQLETDGLPRLTLLPVSTH